MSFSMNYTLEPDTERNIMREKIYGIWNAATAREYSEEYIKTAGPLIKKGNWSKIIDLNNWKSSYPEVIEIIGEHLRWCRDNGMVHSINIIDNPVTTNQLKKMFRVGGTAGISRIFRDHKQGEKFLIENGF
jgi:hypothetical protein